MRHRTPEARRGLIIIPVLVCLVLVGLLAASLLRSSTARRALADDDAHRAQADWLVHSAFGRAAARLAADPSYRGETWALPPADLDGRHAAAVTIAAEAVADRPGRRSVRVVADYPAGTPGRARSSRRLDIPIRTDAPKGGSSP